MNKGIIIRVEQITGRRKVTPSHRHFWDEFRKNAKLDTDYLLEVKPVKNRRRSLPQNALYHGHVVPFFQSAMAQRGDVFSMRYAHEVLKHFFIPLVQPAEERKQEMPDGSLLDVPPSTRMLTRRQFSDMLELMQSKMAEWFDGETFAMPAEEMLSAELEKQRNK